MSDPVAEKSGFLRMYMSNHPDTLVAYAKWYGKVTEPITSAEMTRIDSKSMTLTCTLKAGTKKEVKVPIEPPLKGYDDVKPRLLEMKAIAQEKLGMIKAPQITSFLFPPDAWVSGVFSTIFFFLTLAPDDNGSIVFYPAKIAHATIGSARINSVAYVLAGVHCLESLYTFILCRRHKTGFFLGATYVLATFFCGYPVWRTMREEVQSARIDSVMKFE